ncbi:right-handed parallel beta-helix repeat-containing protein [Pelagicoccus mobilis]|uniref:Right-handed parallel beta-helix repeat-containing protein n=1 Tax=Pelagicoccus mobilis TaxID=415221 RepID=A0A934RV03_9BACT|nr:right-handed parallel beta-helix repeat-containing protein [Pelagicoccus mobilis]MBK1875326.1 right-handed parallel beta-helix repeat-containing protein [Pelagicoccus mobilis]
MRFPHSLSSAIRCVATLIAAALCVCSLVSARVIELPPEEGDMTLKLREALEGVESKDVTIVLSKGTYLFKPDYATQRYCYVTNHNNGLKNIIFPLSGFDSVTIEGNGAELVFHGQVLPFRIEDCDKVRIRDLSIDWDYPFTFLGEVVATNEEEGWRDIRPVQKGYSWKLEKGKLVFPNIDGFKYKIMGATLPFDAKEKRVSHGAWDQYSDPEHVERRPGGILRFHEKLKQYPPVGSLLSSKGGMDENRYAPAFQLMNSRDIVFDGVVVHHALGMGFLFERCEDIVIRRSGVYLKEGTNRVISALADATHFCNCKGDILIENSRFENMLDDTTNVHGTYVVVDEVLNERTVRATYGHFQQLGFEFAGVGDEVWFIHSPDPSRGDVNTVESVREINENYFELRFEEKLPDALAVGDILENKTWNPTFTFRGCIARDHRARNIVIKTPHKIVIEDNEFSSMMSSIFFRGETFFWYESGAVSDVLIRNNRFEYCAYSAMEHAVLYVTPRLGKSFDKSIRYDRNIRFVDNHIRTFDNRIVWADRVEGLVIKGNTIEKVDQGDQLHPEAALFDFKNCSDVEISGNRYIGSYAKAIEADASSRETLQVSNNEGF